MNDTIITTIENQLTKLDTRDPTSHSLMIMLTYACQLDCRYCFVTKKPTHTTFEVIQQGYEALATSKSTTVQVRFFGGEPLIQFELLKRAVIEGERFFTSKGKKVQFSLTTNGILVTDEIIDFFKKHNVHVMFSFDGIKAVQEQNRFDLLHRSHYEKIDENLKKITQSGLDYFVNIVVEKDQLHQLTDSLLYLQHMGVKKVQICYAVGRFWSNEQLNVLTQIINNFRTSNLEILNVTNNAEPVMLSQELLLDTDGKMYFDLVIFLEKMYPELRDTFYIGHAHAVKSIDAIHETKSQLFARFLKTYSHSASAPIQKKVKLFLNNIVSGFYFESQLIRFKENVHESKQLSPLKHASFQAQQDYLSTSLHLKSSILYIQSNCFNDCIMCSQKIQKNSPTSELKLKIQENKSLKSPKISLIGNEVLAHPDIIEIINECINYGFKEIEIMTSGNTLSQFESYFASLPVTIILSLPLFGVNAHTHDSIVQNVCFTDIVSSIKRLLLHENVSFLIHTNILKQNLHELNALHEFVTQELRSPFVALPIRPKQSNLSYNELMPTYTEIKDTYTGPSYGFPRCILLGIDDNSTSSHITDSMKLYLWDQEFIHPKQCNNCTQKSTCLGTFDTYLASHGEGEFSAFK